MLTQLFFSSLVYLEIQNIWVKSESSRNKAFIDFSVRSRLTLKKQCRQLTACESLRSLKNYKESTATQHLISDQLLEWCISSSETPDLNFKHHGTKKLFSLYWSMMSSPAPLNAQTEPRIFYPATKHTNKIDLAWLEPEKSEGKSVS